MLYMTQENFWLLYGDINMALSKVDYNSLNVTAAASKALKWNSGADGFETGDIAGSMVLLATETASSSATVTFDSNIDSTYSEYLFKFIDIHPATDGQELRVNFRDGSTSYDATKNSASFGAYNPEDGSDPLLAYKTATDVAQGTGVQPLVEYLGSDNDQSCAGILHLFDPSNTTFVKHYMARTTYASQDDLTRDYYIDGYCNVTAAIDGVQFSMSSGNIDAGVIKMYGVT